SNVILSGYKDDTTLYLSDLYVVIAIPLKDVKILGKQNEGYRFKYWHKEKSYKEYGVKAIKSAGCYQADSYYNLLCLKDTDYGIYIPPYEIEEWEKILNE
ncbi:MAG: hypothetical protein K2N65_04630, partial [Anaeroplasmataceae bacterium]|nr:hypothetical protein [Anaeroplasmataceae bacterium]